MRTRRCKTRRQQRVSAIELLESRCLLTGPGDFVGDTIDEPTNLGTLAPGSFLSEHGTFGTIEVAGDLDVFKFKTVTPGLAFIFLSADASNFSDLDTLVTLRDASGNIVATNDDLDPLANSDSFLTFLVQGGRTYFVEARGFGPSTGDFVLNVFLDVAGAFPDETVNLGELTVEQPIELSNFIDSAGDFDVFQIQAGRDGPATFGLNANNSNLDAVVTLLDSSGHLLGTNDDFDASESTNSLLTYTLLEGETYFIVASGFGSSTGGYALAAALPTIELPPATDIGVVTAADPLTRSGTIDVPRDRDVYQFQADAPGLVVIQLDAANSSLLDTLVTLLDAMGSEIEEDDDNGLGKNSYLTYSIAAGQTYYIVASGFKDSTGDYSLSVSLPEVLDLGMLSRDEPLQKFGTIGVDQESDFFRFQALANGVATVRLDASESSSLDTRLTVLDPHGAYLTFNDDIQYPSNTNSRLTFDVLAGQTYFIQVEGYLTTTGNYSLSVSLPMSIDLGILTSERMLQRTGEIAVVGEIDLYQFESDKAGLLVLEMDSSEPRTLDTIVTLRDSVGAVLAVNDDVNFALQQNNSRLTFGIEAGETYFIEAGGYGISTGGYQLKTTLLTDNIGGTRSTSFDLGTLVSASPSTPLAIETPGDHDFFQFHVDAQSLVSIALNASDSRALDTVLSILDSSGIQVAFNDDIDYPVNSNSQLSFIAAANQSYFIDVSAIRSGTGIYSLSATAIPAPSAIPLEFPQANVPTRVNGTIAATDIARFRLAPAESNQLVRIELNAASGNLDPLVTVRVLSEDGGVASTVVDDDSGPGLNSLLSLPVRLGQILEIDVSGFRQTAGEFSLVMTAMTAADTFELLNADLIQTNFEFRSGEISQPYERDVFRFTPTISGPIVIDLISTNGSLDPLLTVSTVSDGVVVGRNDDSPFNFGLRNIPAISNATIPVTSLNSHLEIDVSAGVTYDIVAQDFSFGTGSYFLVATAIAQQDDFRDSFDELDALRRSSPRRAIQIDDRHEFGLPVPVSGMISESVANQPSQDVDLLDFQANFTGVLELSLNLDPDLSLSVFRDIRLTGAGSGDYELIDVLLRGSTTLAFPVDESGIYVIRIAGANGAGSYQLSGRNANRTKLDLVPDSIANATPIEFNVSFTSAIDFRHDRDVYRFVAPQSDGPLLVSLDRVNGSNLDTLLVIYDDKGQLVASNDDVDFGAGRLNSRVTFEAQAGGVYYAQAAGLGPIAQPGELNFATGAYRLRVRSAANVAESPPSERGLTGELALLEAATVGLVSIANGAGMLGDRNPEAIRNAVVEAIATLAKQGKLTSDYLVLILDDAPEAGFTLDVGGAPTSVSPGAGVTRSPSGGIVNNGQFAQVVIVPVTGASVPMLQVTGFGSNLNSSFQASMVSRTGSSQSLTSQQVSSRGSSDGKVQLTFALGFDATNSQAIPNSGTKPGQSPSFFLATNAFIKARAADQDPDGRENSIARADNNPDAETAESLRQAMGSLDLLDSETWLKMFEGVLESLQFEGLSRPSLNQVRERLRVTDNKAASEILMRTPAVRSAKAVFEVLKQGASWIGAGQRKTPAPTSKPRTPVPKVTLDSTPPKYLPEVRNGSTKTAHLGG